MNYEAEINFLKKLLQQFHLNVHIITENHPIDEKVDNGLRRLLGLKNDYEKAFRAFQHHAQPNVVYKVSDSFLFHYIGMILPSSAAPKRTLLLIGPFTEQSFSKQDIFTIIEKYDIPPRLTEHLIQHYVSLPLISDSTFLSAIYSTFAETIWGGSDKYIIKVVSLAFSEKYAEHISANITGSVSDPKEIPARMQLLETRYNAENQFIELVAQGNYHKAEIEFLNNVRLAIESRIPDPVRNIKNYCISMNTLLRKAAEQGGVHPIHTDMLSTYFVKEIENVTSPDSGSILMQKMIRKYGLLVKNHSLKDYSPLIQKVITRVDANLTLDQSLNTHAGILDVSPSYLSTLFRKEVGITLTEFVNRRRVECGILLLNTTNMQIQTISQHCGISDINYFTRIFKKIIGKTPKEYRNSIGR